MSPVLVRNFISEGERLALIGSGFGVEPVIPQLDALIGLDTDDFVYQVILVPRA